MRLRTSVGRPGTCVFKRGGRRGGTLEAGTKGAECERHGLVLRPVAVDERSSYDAMRALGERRTREELPVTGLLHTPSKRHWRDAGRVTGPLRW